MKLFTKAQREKLLANGTRRGADHKPVVRLFNPTGAGTWLLTELDPDHPDDYGFGLADLGMGFPELGDIGIRRFRNSADSWASASSATCISVPNTQSRSTPKPRGPQAASSSSDPSSTPPPSEAAPRAPPAPDGIHHTAYRPVPATPGAGRFRFRPDQGDLE